MARKTQAVPYATRTPEQSARMLETAAEEWREWAAEEAGKTLIAARALREAVHTGYLHLGSKDTRPEGSITRSEVLDLFGVKAPSNLTWWLRLARALSLGIDLENEDVGIALLSGKAVRNTDVGKVIDAADATKTKVKAAVKAAGFKVTRQSDGKVRVERVNLNRQGPRTRGQSDQEAATATKDDADKAVAPFDAVKAALAIVAREVKSPTIQGEEWEAIETILRRIVTSERRRRGLDESTRKRTATKRTATKAA